MGQIDFRAIKIDCYTAIDTGLYPFAFGDGAEVKARYALTCKWNVTHWLITNPTIRRRPNRTSDSQLP